MTFTQFMLFLCVTPLFSVAVYGAARVLPAPKWGKIVFGVVGYAVISIGVPVYVAYDIVEVAEGASRAQHIGLVYFIRFLELLAYAINIVRERFTNTG